jgi:hypothetical protein
LSCVAAKSKAVSRSATSVAAATCSCIVMLLGSCMVMLLGLEGGLTECCPIVARSSAAGLLFGSSCFLRETGLIDVVIRWTF